MLVKNFILYVGNTKSTDNKLVVSKKNNKTHFKLDWKINKNEQTTTFTNYKPNLFKYNDKKLTITYKFEGWTSKKFSQYKKSPNLQKEADLPDRLIKYSKNKSNRGTWLCKKEIKEIYKFVFENEKDYNKIKSFLETNKKSPKKLSKKLSKKSKRLSKRLSSK
jgi:hypothetical protein